MTTAPISSAPFTATALIDFPALPRYLDAILQSIATHDMTVVSEGARHQVHAPFGRAWVEPLGSHLRLTVHAESGHHLNRMKHALVGPITFIAAREQLVVQWEGSDTGLAPLDDLRVLRVVQVRALAPRLRRIVLQGHDLAHLDRIDQLHCRLLFPPKGESCPVWPMVDAQGRIVWPGGRFATRVYTLRAIDVAAGTVTIDFALHAQAGPATTWALAAAPGDLVGAVGPAAGGFQAAGFHVFAGDETGLPGIARLLEALDAAAQGVAFIEVQHAIDTLPLTKPEGVAVHWLYRHDAPAGTTSLLPDAVAGITWPSNLEDAFFWGGCEYRAFREIHRILKHEVKLPRARQVLYSHWHRALSEEQIIAVGGDAYLAE